LQSEISSITDQRDEAKALLSAARNAVEELEHQLASIQHELESAQRERDTYRAELDSFHERHQEQADMTQSIALVEERRRSASLQQHIEECMPSVIQI